MISMPTPIVTDEIINTIRDSGRFDDEYYKMQFALDWTGVNPLLHFIEKGALQFASPSPDFDTRKYYAKNPDVYYSGINPLYHYIAHGRFELRSSFPTDDMRNKFDEKKEYANLSTSKTILSLPTWRTRRAAVFASYNEKFVINDYIVYYLEQLKEVCDIIIFVADNYYPPHELCKIGDLIDGFLCFRHNEYDFGSYKMGISILRDNSLLHEINELLLVNDSAYGPLYSFEKLLKNLLLPGYDFYGITNAIQWKEHIQSYFYLFKKNVFCDSRFYDFFLKVNQETKKADIILKYEVELTDYLREIGYVYHSLINVKDVNYSWQFNLEEHPILALTLGSPFVKRKKLSEYIENYEGIRKLLNCINNNCVSLFNIINSEHIYPTLDETVSFSIILPTYNRREMVETAIDSALAQSYQNFELIIIDDGSTDGTESFIYQKYLRFLKVGKCIFVKNQENCGSTYARNLGLKVANNPWIVYLDSDNVMEPHFLEYFAMAITKHNDTNVFYAKFILYPELVTGGKPYDRDELKRGNYIDMGVFVHKRELVNTCGDFDVNVKKLDDYEFILRLTENNTPYFIDTPLLRYNNGNHKRLSNTYDYEKDYKYISAKHDCQPCITTIIPTYNHAAYIQQTLESAVIQSGVFVHEIIVSDDASQDETRNMVHGYALRYPNLIIEAHNDYNLGISGNLKKSIEMARGKYIGILEGDDYWIDPFKLQRQFDFMEANHDCQMCFCGCYILNEETLQARQPNRQINLPSKFDLDLLMKVDNPMISFSSCFFKSKLMDTIPGCLYHHRLSEYALAFYLTEFGNIGYIKDKGLMYRQHAHSAWTGLSQSEQINERIIMYKNIICMDSLKYAKHFTPLVDKLIQELENMTEDERKRRMFNA